MLEKTNKLAKPIPRALCPLCTSETVCVGVAMISERQNIWKDRYFCRYCQFEFAGNISMWCDPSSGEFYAYEVTIDAAHD